MRSVIVCVRTAPAAQTVVSTAARLGLSTQVRTALSEADVMARLAEQPADIILADTALTRPDTVGFTRRVLARSPGTVLLLFGAEDPQVAATTVAAGARALIRGTDDLVSTVAKAVLLLGVPTRPADVPARTPQPATVARGTNAPASVGVQLAASSGRNPGLGDDASGGLDALTDDRPDLYAPHLVPEPDMDPPLRPLSQDDLREVWRLIASSSLGTSAVRRVQKTVDPGRAARLAATGLAGWNDQEDPDDLHFLLLAYVKTCYEAADAADGRRQIRKLADLLIDRNRVDAAKQLWRMAAAAGDPQARAEPLKLGELPNTPGLEWDGAVGSANQVRPRRTPSVPSQRGDFAAPAEQSTGPAPAKSGAARATPAVHRVVFTERELQVLRGMADGKSNAEIGRELFVSEDTVKTHARRLFRKLGARDRAHAVAAGFRAGLVS